jgi:surface antigen
MSKVIPIVLLAAILLTGCVTDQGGQEGLNKKTIGAILGGLAGAVLGSKAGSGKGRLVAVAAGALAGAWLGSEIGASLDRADKLAIQKETARALASSNDGQTINWKNPDSGVSAKITTANTRVEQRQITLIRDKRVIPTSRLELIGETYVTKRNTNVRAAPSTRNEIIGSLQAGETFNAVGRVKDTNWILAAKNFRSIGYVYEPLVRKAKQAKSPELRQPVNLDDIKVDDTVVAEKIKVETRCRNVNYTVTVANGKSANKEFEACKGSDGAWEIL